MIAERDERGAELAGHVDADGGVAGDRDRDAGLLLDRAGLVAQIGDQVLGRDR